jgi:predicted O-methyltransferase YrrM
MPFRGKRKNEGAHIDAFPILENVPAGFPAGHFYSPVINPDELAEREHEIWPVIPPMILGIDFNERSHQRILSEDFPKFIEDYDYPEKEEDVNQEYDFFTRNSQFSWLDARAAFVLMRKWNPTRVIEVGSGFSSLLMADVNRRFLGGKCQLTCIEPYPRPFLKQGVPGISKLIEEKVQHLPLEIFEALESGDMLFIDSSHVSKTGSDVNHLYFEVLPRLKPGVKVHIHDIFLPNEYLKDWVLKEHRSWNEQYLLRALLMYSSAFHVVFGCSYAFALMPDKVKTALSLSKGHVFGGGSFWIEKV